MEGNTMNQAGTLRIILVWATEGMNPSQILQVRKAPHP
jgi:hypothetical protein